MCGTIKKSLHITPRHGYETDVDGLLLAVEQFNRLAFATNGSRPSFLQSCAAGTVVPSGTRHGFISS
ncbi:MAG: hypothetical protein EBS30_10760, partial [Planctomycetes bacterium]|nr:hypothetical protein [Planctomycetota bacterium]